MKQYLDALKNIMENGEDQPTRTGIRARMLPGTKMVFDMADGFPAVTTKKLAFKTMKGELLWFLRGSNDINELHKDGVHIWDADVNSPYWLPKAGFPGDAGRIYGVQWRKWHSAYRTEPIDQLAEVIARIKKDPYDRRNLVIAWNPAEIDMMALPPCHIFFQFTMFKNRLNLEMFQRSADMFLGVPFNIASYSLLLHMIARVTGHEPGLFIHEIGNSHIYENHFDAVKLQLSREPLPLPKLWLDPNINDIDSFTMDGIKLENYQHHPPIAAELSTDQTAIKKLLENTTLSIIAAVAKNGVIGKGNSLPWHLPADLKRFRNLTEGKPVIMGRKTYESIGRALPNRLNIILTSQKDYSAPGCTVVQSMKDALTAIQNAPEVMIIGGAEIYKLFMPLANRIHLTRIHHDFEGDAFFPSSEPVSWHETERIDHQPDEKNPYRYSFITLERNKPQH